jgi:hypothetical protein
LKSFPFTDFKAAKDFSIALLQGEEVLLSSLSGLLKLPDGVAVKEAVDELFSSTNVLAFRSSISQAPAMLKLPGPILTCSDRAAGWLATEFMKARASDLEEVSYKQAKLIETDNVADSLDQSGETNEP